MKMDDPRLTAGALGAMTPDESNAFDSELMSDPELIREFEETVEFAKKLQRAFSTELNAALTEQHWREIKAEAAIIGLSPATALPTPVHRRIPSWVLPAAAGIVFGAIVASVALTWQSPQSALVGVEPAAPASSPAMERSGPAMVVNSATHTDLKSPVHAVIQSSIEGSREAGATTGVLPAFAVAPIQPAAPLPGPAVLATANVVRQSALHREVEHQSLPQGVSGFSPATPARHLVSAAAPQSISSRPDSIGGRYPVAPAFGSANHLPSLPPVLLVSSSASSSDASPTSPNSVSPSPVFEVDGFSGTEFGGTKPNMPDESIDVSIPPAVSASKTEEIAWRRPDFSDALNSVAGGGGSGSGVQSGTDLELLRLDTGMYPTLEHLSAVLEHDSSAHDDGVVEHLMPVQNGTVKEPGATRVEQFCFRDAPGVKVLVVLDNGGAPLCETPGCTPVLVISEPFIGGL
ncbi:MAG: hypothetical protein RL088_3791 [Verrucomicrobiota bacterium]|jgi:hypothetical protein